MIFIFWANALTLRSEPILSDTYLYRNLCVSVVNLH